MVECRSALLTKSRDGCLCLQCQAPIFVAGVETASSIHSTSVEVFDPELGKWVLTAELCNARIYPNAFVS